MKKIILFPLTALMFFAFPNLHAITVLPLDLSQLVNSAQVIMTGICLENRTEIDSGTNLPVTYTTFQTLDILKGDVTQTHTIKQIAMIRGGGVPTFEQNSTYVIFLPPPSTLGFSSPVGLSQGTFRVYLEDDVQMVTSTQNATQLIQNKSATTQQLTIEPSRNTQTKTHTAHDTISRSMQHTDFMNAVKQVMERTQ